MTPTSWHVLTGLAVLSGCATVQKTPHAAPLPERRWNATLAPTANTTGGRMTGSASMSPGPDGSAISVTVANGVPGSTHPWAVHQGQCGGTDGGVVGSPDAYAPMRVGADGRAMGAANVFFMTPSAGSYFISIKTSAASMNTTVACGNLALPAS